MALYTVLNNIAYTNCTYFLEYSENSTHWEESFIQPGMCVALCPNCPVANYINTTTCTVPQPFICQVPSKLINRTCCTICSILKNFQFPLVLRDGKVLLTLATKSSSQARPVNLFLPALCVTKRCQAPFQQSQIQ